TITYLSDTGCLEIQGASLDVLWEDTSRHIVECVISLAEKIGVRTVAEGVETQAQAKCLQALGIYYFQGYYFGRPQTLTVFRKGVSCD
ncbi:EAL domain-containing protein, partial [Escherichia coli]|uniref:EAL domain-containing protein n=1 Tax=Escherichia coli TaxID=562 RepID=UPI000F09CF09